MSWQHVIWEFSPIFQFDEAAPSWRCVVEEKKAEGFGFADVMPHDYNYA